jgi:hypothetical protein
MNVCKREDHQILSLGITQGSKSILPLHQPLKPTFSSEDVISLVRKKHLGMQRITYQNVSIFHDESNLRPVCRHDLQNIAERAEVLQRKAPL